MEEKNIAGEIREIYHPKNGDFGFDDTSFVSFKIKTPDGYFLCRGESFPIFVGENVALTGVISTNEKGNKMEFTSIKIDISGHASKTKYLKFICGNGTYTKLTKGIALNSGRSFKNEKEETEYANDKLIQYLETENYTALSSVVGIGDKTAKKIVTKYNQNAKFEKLYRELSVYGLSLRDCSKIYKHLKKRDDISEIVRKNPYKLMELVGFSFNKCDIFFHKNGGKYNAPCRILAALTYAEKIELSKGHTFSTRDILFREADKILNLSLYNNRIDMNDINMGLNILVKFNKFHIDDKGRVYFASLFKKEEYLRKYVSEALQIKPEETDYKSLIKDYEEQNGIHFGVEQKLAIENSLRNRVSIITGGPGTGKTSSLACIIKLLLTYENVDEDEIGLAAPTGKAAKRMMESINGALGTNMVANTIHTMLETDASNPDLDTFIYNIDNKLPKKVVVIDEASMIDLDIAYALLSALNLSTKLILLGDIEQLPPVGAGYFLRDIIESKISCVKLLEIHRQKGDSTIIDLSQKISKEILTVNDIAPKKDFKFFPLPKASEYLVKMDWIVDLFCKSVDKVGIDQTMILTPLCGEAYKENVVKTHKFGSQQLCLAIQEKLVPYKDGDKQFEKNGWIFREGSKVIVTKNDKSKNIVNGQIGYITTINVADKTIDVAFEEETITLDEDNIENLRLAYAITVHKSQGSEWKNVICCTFGETKMNKKPLVYTAITRAKKSLVVVGDVDTFVGCINNKEEYRRSRILN